jgi:hypothetical protein
VRREVSSSGTFWRLMHIERERGWGAKHLTLTKVTVGRRVILMHTRHALIISETYNHARSDTGVILQCWHEIPTVISLAHPGGCSGASRTHRHGPRPDPDSQKRTRSMSSTPTYFKAWPLSTCAAFLCCSAYWPRIRGWTASDEHVSVTHERPCSTKKS